MADAAAYYYEPAAGHGLRHDPFNAIVGPRPIGWIATRSPDGARNLAPYSFFNAFNYVPPIIGFSTIGWKDTVANAQATGVFVWNLATRALADAMNASCAPVGPEVDEFALAGLTPVPGRRVAADLVLESPVNFECRVTQILRLTTAAGAEVDTWLTLGEVVAVHIDPTLIEEGVYNTGKARPILRAGRMGDYVEVRPDAFFEMRRPL